MSYQIPRSQQGNALIARKKSPLPGGGPWRVLSECPALLHNTASAATRGPKHGRCICPQGLWHRDRAQEQSRNWHRSQAIKKRTGEVIAKAVRRQFPGEPGGRVPSYLGNVITRMPDLTGGACTTPEGRELADKVLGPKYNGQALAVMKHKEMCALRCPLLEICLGGVIAAEEPGGDWGGVYGAMDETERRKLWESRQETAGMKTEAQIASAYRTLDAALAHRKAFDMDVWTNKEYPVTLAELESECGTTACYAGWHAALTGQPIVECYIHLSSKIIHVGRFTVEDLGLTGKESLDLLYCENDQIEEVVEKIFGPRPESAEQL